MSDTIYSLNGISKPIGGHSDVLRHSLGNTESVYTSWTTSFDTALAYARLAGSGAVLSTSVQRAMTVTVPANVHAVMNEYEVLLQGVVRNANVFLTR